VSAASTIDRPTTLPRWLAAIIIGAIALASGTALVWPYLPFNKEFTGPTNVGVIRRQIEGDGMGGRIGAIAPDFEWNAPNGKTLTLSDLRGKTVVINFWATWCKPCLREIPDLSKVYEQYKARGVVMLGVMTDDPDNQTLLNFQSDREMTYPVVRANSDILMSYSYPNALPTTFVYDRGGKEVYSHVGPLQAEELAGYLDGLVAQK